LLRKRPSGCVSSGDGPLRRLYSRGPEAPRPALVLENPPWLVESRHKLLEKGPITGASLLRTAPSKTPFGHASLSIGLVAKGPFAYGSSLNLSGSNVGSHAAAHVSSAMPQAHVGERQSHSLQSGMLFDRRRDLATRTLLGTFATGTFSQGSSHRVLATGTFSQGSSHRGLATGTFATGTFSTGNGRRVLLTGNLYQGLWEPKPRGPGRRKTRAIATLATVLGPRNSYVRTKGSEINKRRERNMTSHAARQWGRVLSRAKDAATS